MFNCLAFEVLIEIEKWLPFLLGVVVVAFDWGILYKKIKESPTKEEVDIMIKKRLEPHAQKIQSIEKDVNSLILISKEESNKTLLREGELKSYLIELKLNIKNICERLDIQYHESNNH